jgi:hypothetical protein
MVMVMVMVAVMEAMAMMVETSPNVEVGGVDGGE